MKKINLFVSFLILFSMAVSAQKLNVATYNIKNDNGQATGVNSWKNRMPYVCNLIQYHDFDIFGTQEGLHNQLEDIKNQIPNLDYIGVGREDGKQKGEYAAIFYKMNKFELLDSGNFWLAENINQPNKGWDASYIRVCTWGKFKDKKSRKIFYFFNIHADVSGVVARRESSKLVLDQIKKIAGTSPTFLTGDLNAGQNEEGYKILNASDILKDSYTESTEKYTNNGTFNGFDINKKSDYRIDHIFVTNKIKVGKYAILTDIYWDDKPNDKGKFAARLPSDHYPVIIEAEL